MSLITGYAYILGLTFAVMDPDFLLDPSNDAGGYAIGQLFFQVFKDRYGSGTGGVLCLGIVAVAIYLCCMNALTSASRLVFISNFTIVTGYKESNKDFLQRI